jgi:hypothetical protein
MRLNAKVSAATECRNTRVSRGQGCPLPASLTAATDRLGGQLFCLLPNAAGELHVKTQAGTTLTVKRLVNVSTDIASLGVGSISGATALFLVPLEPCTAALSN